MHGAGRVNILAPRLKKTAQFSSLFHATSQPAFTCSNAAMETSKQYVRSVRS